MFNKNAFLLVLGMAVVCGAARPKSLESDLVAELALLKQQLNTTRDSLQKEITTRWRLRQQSVEQREEDKEDFAKLTDEQERFNAMVNVKEEGFSVERQLEEAHKKLADKKQEWVYLQTVVHDQLQKEADNISGFFPLDQESCRMELESLRHVFNKQAQVAKTVETFDGYLLATLQQGRALTVVKQTMLPDGEQPQDLTVARFGTVFGYGRGDDGTLYAIGQRGRTGADQYRIGKIENPILMQNIAGLFGGWQIEKRVAGSIVIDIMQNDMSGTLVSGRKETFCSWLVQLVKAGGPVMIPLGLLPLWALLLVGIKLLQFIGKRSAIKRFFCRLDQLSEKGDGAAALSFVHGQHGVAADIAALCIADPAASRMTVESRVKEKLMTESARFGSHLNTLAVIAGVAPLLGLLGTVTGMIRLFEVITRFGTGDPKLLAGGISEALITTEVGLIIAVPVLLVHNFLRNTKNSIMTQLQAGALRLLNLKHPEA